MRRKGAFDFKRFTIKHDRCTMKVGTDAVLLGAWVNVEGAKTILDIGTGSGVIALMLAQRSAEATNIDAVEISLPDSTQAIENVLASPWPNKVKIHHQSIQQFAPPTRYDLIVTNPPYFINSQLPPSDSRKVARHTQELTHTELIAAVDRLLKPDGRFAIVLPVVEARVFCAEAAKANLYPIRELAFFSREGKPQERTLLEFSHKPHSYDPEKLVLYLQEETWTPEYRLLMRDFYLGA